MPALSIIIPVFNSESHLVQCIDSVLTQDFDDFEILLINDGSTDRSGMLCDEYAGRYDNVHAFHKKNEGVSIARNKGIELAQGEYVIFVDSDDWLEKDALSYLMNQEKKADLIFFGSVFRSVNENVIFYCPRFCIYNGIKEVQEGLLDLIINPKYPDYLGFTWNKVFKHCILKEYNIRFVGNLSYREDEAFTLQYAAHCSDLVTLPGIVYNYRVSNLGLTGKWHSKDEFLLLSHAYLACLTFYTDKKIQEYIASQIARNYLNAIKRTVNVKERNLIIEKLWMFYHNENVSYMTLKIKSVYRYLLGLSSDGFMKIYMNVKLLFK